MSEHTEIVEKIGIFAAKDNSIVVSDPYAHSSVDVSNILKGDWNVKVVQVKLPFWGVRNVELFAHHVDHVYPHDEWEVCGRVDVDTATVAIEGIECMSGYGDGSYDVERLVHGNHTVAIRVTFIKDNI